MESMPGATTFKSALGGGLGLKLDPVPVGPEDIAFLQYTGGTTGVAKAAVLTHRNMVANVLQCSAWIRPSLNSGEGASSSRRCRCTTSSRSPANCLAVPALGARNVLITNPRDFKAFVAELKKVQVQFHQRRQHALFNALLHTPGFETVDFSALRVTFGGGMAVQGVVAARWKKVTGCIADAGWGLTETSPVATCQPDGLGFQRLHRPAHPSTDVSIRDDAGQELPVNTWARSACSGRRSCAAIGTARTRPRRSCSAIGCAPATSAHG
jgi:long-chain acyl-CoA synthetase